MRNMLPFLFTLAFSPALALAQETPPTEMAGVNEQGSQDAGRSQFLRDRERGWHWYEVEPEPIKKPKPEEAPRTPETPKPPVLSAQWLKEEFEKATERAISDPTRENVEYWSYLKKLALDKAEKFSEMAMLVTQLNPALDETIQNPVTNQAIGARNLQQSRERRNVLTNLGATTGLVYFYRSDCPYCLKMEPVLRRLQHEYKVSIQPVAIDGKAMPDGSTPNWMPDAGQAEYLGISITPTFYALGPNDQFVQVKVGASSFEELETAWLAAANRAEWISKDQYEIALTGAPKAYYIDKLNAQTVNWDSPKEALEALRAIETFGRLDGTLPRKGEVQGTKIN